MTSTTSEGRRMVRFLSADTECAAWHYPGTNGACIIMGSGTGVTKEPGTDRFAPRFQASGFTVLALDFRRLGGSGGEPRQLVSVDDQVADYEAAFTFARTLRGVDPARIAVWGFSLAGGHVLRVAARNPEVAAVVAQAPLVDAFAIGPNAMRAMTPRAAAGLVLRGLGDIACRRLLRRPPVLVPLSGPRGTVASLTTPDGARGGRALDPDGRYRDWEQTVAAGSALRIGLYRPGRAAIRVRCPLLVVAYDADRSVLSEPARRLAGRAARGELVLLAGDHYAAFDAQHQATLDAETAFLLRHLLDGSGGGPTVGAAGADVETALA